MKVLYVIAQDKFKDVEYLKPKEMFEKENIEVVTAAKEKAQATGVDGAIVDVDIAIEDVNMDDYAGIVIAGGAGSMTLKGYDPLQKILYEARKDGKIIAAICLAPLILADAGLLMKVSATVWDSEGKQINELRNGGALYFEEDVVEDRIFVTANGPHAAETFADSIIQKLQK